MYFYVFTTSRGGNWLLGASREEVSFSTDGVDSVIEKLITRSKEYLRDGVLGEINSSKIGFRPFCAEKEDSANGNGNSPFRIKCEDNVIFCYGFEGEFIYLIMKRENVSYFRFFHWCINKSGASIFTTTNTM